MIDQRGKHRRHLQRAARPFDQVAAGHVIVRTAEELGWNLTDAAAFAKRAQHIEFGLSAEVEFAVLLRWLGKCTLVHRLNEDAFRDEARAPWEPPDLLAVFETDNGPRPALIEVKTTQDSVLTLTKTYFERLSQYAKGLGLPLLIAWKPREIGMWLLVDPNRAEASDNGKLAINLNTALRNDLMGLLAGDFYLAPLKGAGLRLIAKRIGEKEPIQDGYVAKFRIVEAGLHDANGVRSAKVSEPLFWMIASQMETIDDIQGDHIVQSFVASGGLTRAQLVLCTALSFPLNDDERVHWREVATDCNILQRDELLDVAKRSFGTYVQYVIFQRPQKIPTFLLKSRARTTSKRHK